MKTVEVVKISIGYYVTRRYCSQNHGRAFFYTVAPKGVKREDRKDFLAEQKQAQEKYINDWIDE